jgi:hypothetical protein
VVDRQISRTDFTDFSHHIGSIVAITDEAGDIAEQLAYDPHGLRREAD